MKIRVAELHTYFPNQYTVGEGDVLICANDGYRETAVVGDNDRMFHRMSDDEWDAVIDVHLNGARNVASAAAATRWCCVSSATRS